MRSIVLSLLLLAGCGDACPDGLGPTQSSSCDSEGDTCRGSNFRCTCDGTNWDCLDNRCPDQANDGESCSFPSLWCHFGFEDSCMCGDNGKWVCFGGVPRDMARPLPDSAGLE
jgi:hypothetical protein